MDSSTSLLCKTFLSIVDSQENNKAIQKKNRTFYMKMNNLKFNCLAKRLLIAVDPNWGSNLYISQ